jgi:leader peptidase (prepilin peptidase)/N-methyltransferase
MLVAAAIDARTQWLPDVLTLPLLWAGLVFGALGTGDVSLAYRIFAIVGVYLTLRAVAQGFFLLRGVHGLGGGDIKLLAALAAWLPLSSVAYVLLIGSALQLAGMALTRTRQSSFGPCLCVAAVGCLLANWWA